MYSIFENYVYLWEPSGIRCLRYGVRVCVCL